MKSFLNEITLLPELNEVLSLKNRKNTCMVDIFLLPFAQSGSNNVAENGFAASAGDGQRD